MFAPVSRCVDSSSGKGSILSQRGISRRFWANLMVDFDDAQNAKSDKEMTNDEIEKMKHDSDMQEAQKLFD